MFAQSGLSQYNNNIMLIILMLNVKMIEFNNNSNEVLMQESKYHIKQTVLSTCTL